MWVLSVQARRDAIGQVAVVAFGAKQFCNRKRRDADRFGGRADDDRRFGQLDNCLEFRMRQPPRHRLRNRAKFPRRITRLDELDTVRQRDGEEVAFAHAALFERPRNAVGTAMKFVPAPLLAFAGNGQCIALTRGFSRQRRADGDFSWYGPWEPVR